MTKVVDNCVGCADGCHNCGLNHDEIEVCDKCECESMELFNVNGNILCPDCAMEYIFQNYSLQEIFKAIKFTDCFAREYIEDNYCVNELINALKIGGRIR